MAAPAVAQDWAEYQKIPDGFWRLITISACSADTVIMGIRRLVAGLMRRVLHAVSTLLVAAGVAALAATLFALQPPSPAWAEWLATIRRTALSIGMPFLIAGAACFFLLPSRTEFLRLSHESDEGAPVFANAGLPMGVLAIAAAAQLPMLLVWWNESQGLLRLLIGAPDPWGFWIIPAVLIGAPPFIASLILALCVVTSVAVAVVRRTLARSVLSACVTLQSGLVIGSALALPEVRGLVARVLALAASGPDGADVTAIAAAVERQDGLASTLLLRFEWILGGYLIAAAAMWYAQREDSVAVQESKSTDVFEIPPRPLEPPPPEARVSLSSPGDDYRVRLRTSWLSGAFRLASLDYDVIPLASQIGERFVFVGASGLLRREPDGLPLVSLQRKGLLKMLGASYLAKNASTDQLLMTFAPDGADWVVVDPSERRIARIEEVGRHHGYCEYRMLVDGSEFCRFTWGMQGLGIWTAEMTVEFARSPVSPVDRTPVLAFATVLDAEARRAMPGA